MDTPTYHNYIGGRWVPAADGATSPNRNPARWDEVLGQFPASTAADAEGAVQAAAAALPGWRRTSAVARGDLLYRAAQILDSRAETVARDLAGEEGKTLPEALGETRRGVAILRYFAGQGREADGATYPATNASTFLFTRHEPLGVVALLTPWNFPIAIPLWKAAPALVYGNPVVLKPASLTPRTAVHLAEVFEEAGLPPGVFNLVIGAGGAVGDTLVTHPAVAGVSFTGSAAVGHGIKMRATERGKKVQLELGGKNPVIVLADADLDQAVQQTLNGAMLSAGQKCTATSRAIVERSLLPRFTAALVERVRGLRVGDPLETGVQIGPVVSPDARQSITGYIATGRQEGGRVLVGDATPLPNGGNFIAPTLFDQVDPGATLARDEVFGPVLALLPADDLAGAVSLANAVEYGLSASIFTRDIGRAFAFIREIEAGIVHVNSETAGAEPHVPFGGMKGSSSYSREQGKAAVEFFTQTKTVYLDMPPE